MPFSDSNELRAIIFPRVASRLFEGYFGGTFNEDKTKFLAATLVKTAGIDYRHFEYEHESLGGASFMFLDHSKLMKYITPTTCTGKSKAELIAEGVCSYFSVAFIGLLFENEWFILKTLSFYGDEKTEAELIRHIEENVDEHDFWNDSLFLPPNPMSVERGGKKIPIRDVHYEEFKYTPYLVVLIKQHKKEMLNRAFVEYFKLEFAVPFFEKMRIANPDEYRSFSVLGDSFYLIYPATKSCVIIAVQVENKTGKWCLRYYILHQNYRCWHEWVYFRNEEYNSSFHFANKVIDNLKTITHWDDFSFLNTSCTMDDEVFWSDYVLKQENGEYLYLKRCEVG